MKGVSKDNGGLKLVRSEVSLVPEAFFRALLLVSQKLPDALAVRPG